MREESNEGRRAKCKQRASTTPGHFSAANRSRCIARELSSQWPIECRRRQTPCLGGKYYHHPFLFFLDKTYEQPAACVPTGSSRPSRPLRRRRVPSRLRRGTTALVPAVPSAPYQTSHNFPTPLSPHLMPPGRGRQPGPAPHAASAAQLSFLRRCPPPPPRRGAPRSRIPPPHRTAAAERRRNEFRSGRGHGGSPAPRIRPARGWAER